MEDYLNEKAAYGRAHPAAKPWPLIVITALLLVLTLAAAAASCYVYYVVHPYENYDRILPNVYCAGVELSGMTQTEAKQAIEEAFREPVHALRVVLPDCEYTFQPAQEGLTLNSESIASRAYAYGRSDPSAYGIYKAFRRAKGTEYRLNPETALEYSKEDIETLAGTISRETYIAPTESQVTYDPETHTVSLTLGTPGRRIDPQTVYQAVCGAFDDLDFTDIPLSYDKVEIDLAAVKDMCRSAAYDCHQFPVHPEASADEEAHAIFLTMGTQGWKLDGNALYDLAEEAVQTESYGTVELAMEPIEPREADISGACESLTMEPTEPYYYGGTVLEGSPGYTLDWDAAAELMAGAGYGETITIPMTEVAPKRTASEIQAVLFRDQLGACSTDHTANSSRTNNLILACKAINGTVLNAGDRFSFNGTVGERTSSKGYLPATVYVGTESTEQLGGGICQVASTIYDAALYAEMEILSRAAHTFFVTYVPGGLDATVYWGALDFSFRNSTEYPVRVNAWVSGGQVHITLDGTKTNDHVVKLQSVHLGTTPYGTVYVNDSSKPKGYEKETTYPYTGYSYEAYQNIYDGNGNLLESNYLGYSSYSKRDRVITVGTG